MAKLQNEYMKLTAIHLIVQTMSFLAEIL